MKKRFWLLLAACMLLLLAACGARKTESTGVSAAQTLSAVFRRNGQETRVSVEIDGWSAELDTDELTFYDGVDQDRLVASGRVLDRTEFDQLVAENSGNATFSKTSNGVKYNDGVGGTSSYIFAVGSGVYYKITARFGAGAEAIFDRFRVTVTEGAAAQPDGVDYLVLVNKLHPLPEDWEDALGTVRLTNAHGEEAEVEAKAYAAYLRLKEALAAEDITVELDHALPVGGDEPEGSENGTGLALDLYLRVGKEDIYPVYDTGAQTETWQAVHAKLAEYGFILRYPKLKEHITGFSYDAGHIRYIDDPALARRIMDAGITLEEYLGVASSEAVEIDLGTSNVFGPMKLHYAGIEVKCAFAGFADCTLHSLRYAGDDESNTPEKVAWLSEQANIDFMSVAKFETDFRAGANAREPLTPNTEYKAYPWWLGRTEAGAWHLVCWGVDAPAGTG